MNLRVRTRPPFGRGMTFNPVISANVPAIFRNSLSINRTCRFAGHKVSRIGIPKPISSLLRSHLQTLRVQGFRRMRQNFQFLVELETTDAASERRFNRLLSRSSSSRPSN